MIELRLFGVLSLKRDGLELNSLLAQPKRVALLAYLCAAAPYGFHRRDSLIGLFWPESDDAHARASLRNALHNLRRALGDSAIEVRGDDEVCVNSREVLCDARVFTELVATHEDEKALALYTGELLPGFFIDEASGFEHWLTAHRAKLRAFAAEAARRLSDTSAERGRPTDAVSFAVRALELSDYDERDVRRLMTLHARARNSSGAIKVYEAYASRLAKELGAQPSEDLRQFANALRKGSRNSPEPGPGGSGPLVTAAPVVPIRGNGDLPRPQYRTPGMRGALATALTLAAVLTIAAYVRGVNVAKRPQVTRTKLTSTGTTLMAALSPDGQFLAFVSQDGDSQRVVLHDVAAGGERTLKSVAGAIWSLEWSRDGTRILIGGFPNAVVLSRLDTFSKTSGPTASGQVMAYWLPDSARFSVHTSGDRAVVVVDPRTQESRSLPVTGSYTWLNEGDWSPTGRLFAVMTDSNDPLSSEIRTANFQGGTHIVVRDTVPLGSPRWSQDGAFLYYARNANSIWRVRTDPTTGEARGTPDQILDDLEMYPQRFGLVHFALSADSHSLVYARGERFSNLWLISEGVSGAPLSTALTRGTKLRWSPTVSPDGRTIAFAQQTEHNAELFTMPISGGEPRQVTEGARIYRENQIAWSPDGKKLAFTTVRRGVAHIWSADVATGKVTLIGGNPSTSTGLLAWAPGRRIAYERGRNENVGLIDPSSGVETSLMRDSAPQAVHSPQYSPDGSHIAAYWYRGGPPTGALPSGVYVFDLRRATHHRVGSGLFPRGWSPDGKAIFYQWPQSPVVYRAFADGRNDSSEVALRPAFREAQCFPVGPSRPHTFVCAVFDFTSDIWRVENFDR